jgi:hypothetical protein
LSLARKTPGGREAVREVYVQSRLKKLLKRTFLVARAPTAFYLAEERRRRRRRQFNQKS